MSDAVDVRENVLRVLRESPGPMFSASLGSKLARQDALGRPFQELGLGKLRDFIERYLSDEVEVRREGTIVTFSLKQAGGAAANESTQGQTAPPASRFATDLLRTWRSPRAKSRLVVRVTDGNVRAVGPDRSPETGQDERVLEPVSQEFLMKIAREFATSLDDPLKSDLLALVNTQNSEWWKAWSELFRDKAAAVGARWLRERHQSLHGELNRQLTDLGLDASAVEKAMRQIEARSDRSPHPLQPADRGTFHRASLPDSPRSLREAIRATVERLSEHELREIWLPAGVLYDVIKA